MLNYIPLKTQHGEVVGMLKQRNHVALLTLRRNMPGQAYLITPSGFVRIKPGESLQVTEPIYAVAALDGQGISYWGAVQGSSYNPARLLADLLTHTGQRPMQPPPPHGRPTPHPPMPPHGNPPPRPPTPPHGNPPPPSPPHGVPPHGMPPRGNPPPPRGNPMPPPAHNRPTQHQVPVRPVDAADADAVVETMAHSHAEPAPMQEENTPIAFGKPAELVESSPQTGHAPEDLAHMQERVERAAEKAALPHAKAEIPLQPMVNKVPIEIPPVPVPAAPMAMPEKEEPVQAPRSICCEQEPPQETRIPVENPFKKTFPGAEFCSVTGENTLSHLCGTWKDARTLHQIIAVPGEYAPEPPAHLFGFTRYIQCRDAGYWIKITE